MEVWINLVFRWTRACARLLHPASVAWAHHPDPSGTLTRQEVGLLLYACEKALSIRALAGFSVQLLHESDGGKVKTLTCNLAEDTGIEPVHRLAPMMEYIALPLCQSSSSKDTPPQPEGRYSRQHDFSGHAGDF